MGDNSTPHGGSGSADSYIGSRISLTSKSEIRYEGILYSIDTENSNIALQDVMSFGTEGRKKDGPQIPRSDKVYDFIIFRGSDIKDLQVISSPSSTAQSIPTPHNDPAIISQSQYTHAAPIASRFGAPPNGNVAVERSHPVPYPPSAPSGNFRNVMPHMYQPWGLPPTLSGGDGNMGMPMYWPGYYVPSPPPPPPPPAPSTAPASSSLPIQGSTSDLLSLLPPLLDDATVASASLDLNALLLSPNSAPSSAPPNTVVPSVSSLSQSMPPLVSSSSSSSSTATATTTTSSSLSTVNSSTLPPTALKVAMPEQSSSEAPKPTKVINQEPLLPLPPTSIQERQYRQVNNGALAHSSYARRGRGRGRGGTALYQVKQFTEDFDFDAMNAKFKKFGVSEEPTDDAEDGGSNDEAQHDSRNASVVDPPEKPVYVKDDFFDSLSCAVLDRAASAERFKMSEQRKVDVETFGNFSSRFRAGGRGHRGGRRGGGSYYYGGRRGGIGRGNVYGRRGRGSAEHYS